MHDRLLHHRISIAFAPTARALRLALLLVVVGCATAPRNDIGKTPAEASAEPATDVGLAAITDAYIAQYAASYPTLATQWGIHAHDRMLPDLSEAGVQARIGQLKAMLAQVQAIERATLQGHSYYDHRLLEYALRAELLGLEEIRTWQRNPMIYNGIIARGVATLVDRTFAPLDQRLDALIARLEAIPRVIAAAKLNLRDVPQVWARIGARLARGTASFLRTDLPAALAAQGLADLSSEARAQWNAAQTRAVAQVASFADWLETDLMPRANGDVALGRDLFERKLRFEEHVELSADELRDMNQAAIAKYQAWVAREAARIDPNKTPAEVMAAITAEYPQSDQLLATAREYVQDTRAFVISHDLLTLPSDSVPIVRATPQYARTGFASMSVPGPFETVAKEAYYNITLVDPTWDQAKQHQHLTYFNYPSLLGISVHEAFPGHYVQLLYRAQLPTVLRKVLTPGSLVEGWAHYTEQMMVDVGLGNGDPKVRLAQLRRALQRHARWYAALAIHVFDVPVATAAARFQEIAYFAPFPALRETERATYNPTYLYYALGRMQILALRDQYRQRVEARGETFALRDFHDRFLRLGLPPTLASEVLVPPQ